MGILGIFFGVAIIFPFFGRAREYDGARRVCAPHLKIIGLAFIQYSQDYDGHLPKVESSGGWANAIVPYATRPEIFQCPLEGNTPTNTPANTSASLNVQPTVTSSDFFFNSQLSGRDMDEIERLSSIVCAAEGNDGIERTDASYAKPMIPVAWRTDVKSPLHRHSGRGTYLFLDGHVKMQYEHVISDAWSANKFYFQPPKLKLKQ